MYKGEMQNISMMATCNNNPSNLLWSIKTPPFVISSPPSSSSSITTNNFLLPPSYNNSNNIFQVDQDNNNNTNMNMFSTTLSSSWLNDDYHVQHQPSSFPQSLSQLLLNGIMMGEAKKIENWEEQFGIIQQNDHMKQENSINNNNNSNVYNNNHEQEFHVAKQATNNIWSSPHQIITNIPTSSPQSCVSSTTFSDNLLHPTNTPLPISDHTSECNSTATGGAVKKPRIQACSNPTTTFKVRKEKLGDRVTALHQLVSPFGKTDTASVLLESIGYIRFLHNQIEALSVPYLKSEAGDIVQPRIGEGERKCIFPEDPGQLLDENCLKRKRGPNQESYEESKDLKSRGLCLVPISCTMNVESNNGADYWAPALTGGGFH